MKKLLNTLYITAQGTYLSKDGECVLVRGEDGASRRFPLHVLDGIVCFGNVLCSPFLLGHCAEQGLAVSFLTEHGRFLAMVRGPTAFPETGAGCFIWWKKNRGSAFCVYR